MFSNDYLAAAKLGYAATFTTEETDVIATGTAIAIKNTHSGMYMCIERVNWHSSVESEVEVHEVVSAATPSGDAVVTGQATNRPKGQSVQAEAATDDTANATQGTVLDRKRVYADTREVFDYGGSIVIDTNNAFCMDVKEASAEVQLTVFVFWKGK